MRFAFRPATGFLVVGVHLDAAARSPRPRDRLSFWTAHAGGRTTSIAALSPGNLAQLRTHLAACDLTRAGVSPVALADVAAGFFTEAGAPAGRALDPEGPVLALEVGGSGWEGFRWAPERQVLFVPAPVAPAVGDELPVRFGIRGAPAPVEVKGTVVEVVAASAAPPGRAGYGLLLDAPPPALVAALEAAQVPGARTGAAPRSAASVPKVIALPPPEAAPPAPDRPRRALVVDDDALLRRMLGDALVARGFEVLTAPDAQEGIRPCPRSCSRSTSCSPTSACQGWTGRRWSG